MAVSISIFGSNALKFDDVGVILSEEIRRKSTNETSTSGNVLNVEDRGRSKEREKPWRSWEVTREIEEHKVSI